MWMIHLCTHFLYFIELFYSRGKCIFLIHLKCQAVKNVHFCGSKKTLELKSCLSTLKVLLNKTLILLVNCLHHLVFSNVAAVSKEICPKQ